MKVAVIALMLLAGTAVAQPAMTKSKAGRIARAVSLTTSDLPSYSASESGPTPGEDMWGGKVYARCSGRKGLGKALADVTRTFEREHSNRLLDVVGSEVEVMPKARYVKQDLALARTARGRACLLKEIRRGYTQSDDPKLVSAKVTKLAPGVARGVALRAELTVQPSNAGPITFFLDFLVVGDRNVEAAVVAIQSGDAPTRADEDDLLGIVRTRLKAQLHPDETIL